MESDKQIMWGLLEDRNMRNTVHSKTITAGGGKKLLCLTSNEKETLEGEGEVSVIQTEVKIHRTHTNSTSKPDTVICNPGVHMGK